MRINIVANKDVDRRIYNKPTSDEIAVIIPKFGESLEPTRRDALCFEKNGSIKIINPNQEVVELKIKIKDPKILLFSLINI